MSIEALCWAWKQELPSAGRKLVLVALADAAHEDGECWPSYKTLAKKTGLAAATVRGYVTDLGDAGLLKKEARERSDGSQTSNRYWLQIEGADGSAGPGDAQRSADGAAAVGADGSAPHYVEPKAEPTTKPNGQESLLPSDVPPPKTSPVAEIWAHYQTVVPNAQRRVLDGRRRRIIEKALKVRTVEDCIGAITGLSRSDFHRGQNDRRKAYLDIEYALGLQSESPDKRIDDWLEKLGQRGSAHDAVQARLADIPQDRKHIVSTDIQRVKARFSRPQHEPTVRMGREAEAALREYPGIEVIENEDGSFAGWRLVNDPM
jgi:hypothetical protein